MPRPHGKASRSITIVCLPPPGPPGVHLGHTGSTRDSKEEEAMAVGDTRGRGSLGSSGWGPVLEGRLCSAKENASGH